MTIMSAEASKCQLRDLVKKFIPESIGKDIENACKGIFPLQHVFIRKVKMLKKPKFDRKYDALGGSRIILSQGSPGFKRAALALALLGIDCCSYQAHGASWRV